MSSTLSHTAHAVGSTLWMAPEVMRAEPYTLSADVYGYAIILYELTSNQLPFQGLNQAQVIRRVTKGERPPLPDKIDNTLKQIIEKVSFNSDLFSSFPFDI